MFVKTSHPEVDNGWCWVLGVISPDAPDAPDADMGPDNGVTVSRDAITSILFTSPTQSMGEYEKLYRLSTCVRYLLNEKRMFRIKALLTFH